MVDCFCCEYGNCNEYEQSIEHARIRVSGKITVCFTDKTLLRKLLRGHLPFKRHTTSKGWRKHARKAKANK